MGTKSTILELLTAAQVQSHGAAPSTTLLGQLARGLRINRESNPAQSSCGRTGFRKELDCLARTITQLEQLAEASHEELRSCSKRFVAVRVALENMSASNTATHDRDFAFQIARLTKAQMLSLTPLRPHINGIPGKHR